MSTRTMWNVLKGHGLTDAGAAGLLGNFRAESLLLSNNVEDRCPLSDAEYTQQVDDGTISREQFSRDGYGYGLYQLTYWTRKQGYYDYVKSKGVSIADESAQVDYCMQEMVQDYPKLYSFLRTTTDLNEAADRVCREFERPAVNNYSLRRRYAEEILASMGGTVVTVSSETTPPEIGQGSKGLLVGMAQFCLIRKGYSINQDCDYGPKTTEAVKSFQNTQRLNTTGRIDAETWRRLWR